MVDKERAATQAQVKLARSAGAMEHSIERQADDASRRTELAADRTLLAAERTYAAWVRTGLAALASGVGARALLDKVVPVWLTAITGTVLVLFGAFCFGCAVWRQIKPAALPPKPDTQRVPDALLILMNGFLVLVSIAVLIGLWTG